MQKPYGLRFFAIGVLILTLLIFISLIVLDGISGNSWIPRNNAVSVDGSRWYARRGFSPGDVDGFSENDNLAKPSDGFPIILNELFGIPSGSQTNDFTLMTKFNLPQDLQDQTLALVISELGHNWEVYLNGSLIRREVFLNEDGSIRVYRSVQRTITILPRDLLKHDQNILVFRIIGDAPVTSLFSGRLPGFSMGVGSYIGTTRDISRERAYAGHLSFFLIGMYFFWGLFMILFFARRKELYALLFSSFLLLLSGYAFFSSTFVYDYIQNTATIIRMLDADLIICVPIIGMCFRNFLSPDSEKSIPFIWMSILALFGVLLMALLPFQWVDLVFRIYVYLMVAEVAYIVWMVLSASKHNKDGAKAILVATLIIVLIAGFGFLDTIYFRTGIDLIPWAPFCLSIVFASILTVRYSTLSIELDEKNILLKENTEKLEEVIKTKTEELANVKSAMDMQLYEISTLQTTLKEQAMHDPLTGLYNRRYMEDMVKKEFARAERKDYPISVVLLDIDHFKKLNDQYSHTAGDRILQMIGRVLAKNTRVDDYAIRYGGEEFLIIFPQTPYSKAMIRANQVREMINAMTVEYNGAKLQITISGGVAGYPDHGLTQEQVISCADIALYRAKNLGRNRVEAFLLVNNGGQLKDGSKEEDELFIL